MAIAAPSTNGQHDLDSHLARLQAALIAKVEHTPDPRTKLRHRKRLPGESETQVIPLGGVIGLEAHPANGNGHLFHRDPLDCDPQTDPPIAWALEPELIKAGHQPETIDALIAEGLAVRWEVGRERYIVLTPLGMWRARVAILERWVPVKIDSKKGTRYYAVEVPCWIERPADELGDTLPIKGPMKVATYADECRMPFPERAADKRKGPVEEAIEREEYLTRPKVRADGRFDVDPDTGQVRKQRVTLFGGRPVKIDRRMRGKSRVPTGQS